MALNLAPFGRWMLRDKAAQRRLALRSSALRADERARVVPNIGFSALRAVEPSLERHPFGATSSSRTRVTAAHHRRRNSSVFRRGGGSAPCGMTLNSRPLGGYMNDPAYEALTQAAALSEVRFVHDYAQFVFCPYGLSIYGKVSVLTKGLPLRPGDVGYFDSICTLIDQRLVAVTRTTGVQLEFKFSGGTSGSSALLMAIHSSL